MAHRWRFSGMHSRKKELSRLQKLSEPSSEKRHLHVTPRAPARKKRERMAKTKDALKILDRITGKDENLKWLSEEEALNVKVARCDKRLTGNSVQSPVGLSVSCSWGEQFFPPPCSSFDLWQCKDRKPEHRRTAHGSRMRSTGRNHQ
jgi:hypothetical protein